MTRSNAGMTRRQAAPGLLATAAVPARAQEWTPTQPITILVRYLHDNFRKSAT